MVSSGALLPIENEELSEFLRRANGFLARVEWRPKTGALRERPETGDARGWRDSVLDEGTPQQVSLIKMARTVSRDEALLSDDINHALHVVRKGLQIGMHLSKLYTEASGLERLVEQNRKGALVGAQKVAFRAKYHTAAAIAVFAAAYFVVTELAGHKAEELGNLQLEFPGIPELSLQNPVRAIQCMLYYFGAVLDSPSVGTDLDFVKMTQLYFQGILDEVKLRENSFEHTAAFTDKAYKLEDNDFTVQGFQVDFAGAEVSVEFNRVALTDIVGNRDAKHGAQRLVERLLCYDVTTQRNPFVELGGFPRVRLGFGKPGTGKSLQIAATATMLHDRCRELGLPFLFWPMPDTVVSTFQGGSAERMVAWMRPLQDPSKIIYAPIDDAENNLEDRTRQGVSAGVREVIGVFLRYTEGAYAINHGNAAIDVFTNLPDQIDKAVLSRVVARFAVDGAESWEDFLDQDHLWWRKYLDIDRKFVDMKDPKKYDYLAAQAQLGSLSEVYDGIGEASEERIRDIFDDVAKERGQGEHGFFAELYRQVHQAFPFFTSRDVRNIQQAINGRIMDFDLPETWFEDLELFFARDYGAKKAMLIELMHANMQGLSFAEVRLQETVRYLDNMVRIAQVTRERRIDEMVEDVLMRGEVADRVETLQDDLED